MKKILKSKKYLLHWKNNPFLWDLDIEQVIEKKCVIRIDGEYYSKVTAHFTGNFNIVDCTVDNDTGDFYPINTDLLIEI